MAIVTEADIFSRVIDPTNPTLTADAAKAILEFSYRPDDQRRMTELAGKSDAGTLTPEERDELKAYVRVGDVLALMKSKARLSLQKRSPAA